MKKFLAVVLTVSVLSFCGCWDNGGGGSGAGTTADGTAGNIGGGTNTTPPADIGSPEASSDKTPPVIEAFCPPAIINSNSVGINLRTNEANTRFFCSLDGAPEAECASPVQFGGLGDGGHSLRIYGTDAAGNRSKPISCSWTTDTIIPTVTITSCPAGESNMTGGRIAFTANEDGSTFYCRMDSAEYSKCSSEFTYSGLSDALHVFRVYAVDRAGNPSTEKECSWTVDTVRPVVSLSCPAGFIGPDNSVAPSDQYVNINFSSTKPSTYACRLDITDNGSTLTNDFVEGCGEWIKMGIEKEGLYTFKVVATDSAGNVSDASCSWTVDRTPPTKPVLAGTTGWRSMQITVPNYSSIDPNIDYFETRTTSYPNDKYCTYPFDNGAFKGSAILYKYPVKKTSPLIPPSSGAYTTTSGSIPKSSIDQTVISLDASNLTAIREVVLFNGVPYRTCIRAVDKAGNRSEPAVIEGLTPRSKWKAATGDAGAQISIGLEESYPAQGMAGMIGGGSIFLAYAACSYKDMQCKPKMFSIPSGHAVNGYAYESLPDDSYYSVPPGNVGYYYAINNPSMVRTADGAIHLFYIDVSPSKKYKHTWKYPGDTEWKIEEIPTSLKGTPMSIVAAADGNDLFVSYYEDGLGLVSVRKGEASGGGYKWGEPVVINPLSDDGQLYPLLGYSALPSIGIYAPTKGPEQGTKVLNVFYTCRSRPGETLTTGECFNNGSIYHAKCDLKNDCSVKENWTKASLNTIPNNYDMNWMKVAFDSGFGCIHYLYQRNDGTLQYATNSFPNYYCAPQIYSPLNIATSDAPSVGIAGLELEGLNYARVTWYNSSGEIRHNLVRPNDIVNVSETVHVLAEGQVAGQPAILTVPSDGSTFICYAKKGEVNGIYCFADWDWPEEAGK